MADIGESQGRGLYDETIFSSPEIIAGRRFDLHAERPSVEKRDVRGRLAIVTRRAVTVRKTVEVDVVHEELHVSYQPGDATEMLNAEPSTFTILLRAEEIEIVKRVRVVEEVIVSKRRVSERKRVDLTLRHERLEVLDVNG